MLVLFAATQILALHAVLQRVLFAGSLNKLLLLFVLAIAAVVVREQGKQT